ncbi:MAG: Spy/CpxP family protein refolding chaperone [Terriglobales bacterium]
MRSKYVKWTGLLLLVIAGGVLAFAQVRQHYGGRGMGMHGRFLHRMARYLELTEAQKAQIKSMWQAEKPAVMPLVRQLADARKQMLQLTANGSFDQEKVQALANQQSQALAQLIVEKQKLESQIYSRVLTPEQRTKVDQMRQKHTARIDTWLQKLEGGAGD